MHFKWPFNIPLQYSLHALVCFTAFQLSSFCISFLKHGGQSENNFFFAFLCFSLICLIFFPFFFFKCFIFVFFFFFIFFIALRRLILLACLSLLFSAFDCFSWLPFDIPGILLLFSSSFLCLSLIRFCAELFGVSCVLSPFLLPYLAALVLTVEQIILFMPLWFTSAWWVSNEWWFSKAHGLMGQQILVTVRMVGQQRVGVRERR